MLVWDFFKRFLLFAQPGSVVKRISWLTMVGITVSVMVLILVLSVMTALNQNISERTLAVEPHLSITLKAAGALEKHPVIQNVEKNKDWKVSVSERQDVILRTAEGRFRGAEAKGMSEQALSQMFSELAKVKSRSLAVTPVSLGPSEVILGVDLAHVLGVFEGQDLTVISPEALLLPPTETPKFEKVRVKQIVSTNLADVDSGSLFFVRKKAFTSLQQSAGRRMSLEIRLPSADQADSVKAKLQKAYPDLLVETWKDRNSALFFALKLEKLMIGIFLGMATMVAGLSLISVLSLLISQKQKEIGLLQSLGLSRRATHRLFFKLGFILAAMGIWVGSLLGTGLSTYLQLFPLNILPDFYYDTQIPAKTEPLFILMIFAIGMALSAVASWLVARSALLISPSQALRAKN